MVKYFMLDDSYNSLQEKRQPLMCNFWRLVITANESASYFMHALKIN